MIKDAMKKPSQLEFLAGSALFVLSIAAVGGWLFMNGEATIQKRQESLPVVKTIVTLARPEAGEETTTPIPAEPEIVPITNEKHVQEIETKPPMGHSTEHVKELSIKGQDETKTVTTITTPEVSEPEINEPNFEQAKEVKSSLPSQMVKAPVPYLAQETSLGTLPVASRTGDVSWKTYAKPVSVPDGHHRIALILNNTGLSTRLTEQAFTLLPKNTTLSFNPYAANISTKMSDARAKGFEVLMNLPMEPSTYPLDDPGPKTLLKALSKTQNLERTHWSMGRGTGYTGMMNHMGSSFLNDAEALEPVAKELATRGLLFVDTLNGLGQSTAKSVARKIKLPYISSDLVIDEIPTKEEIGKQLEALEVIAKESGYAVGVLSPYLITMKQIKQWQTTLEDKNISLVPISNLLIEGK